MRPGARSLTDRPMDNKTEDRKKSSHFSGRIMVHLFAILSKKWALLEGRSADEGQGKGAVMSISSPILSVVVHRVTGVGCIPPRSPLTPKQPAAAAAAASCTAIFLWRMLKLQSREGGEEREAGVHYHAITQRTRHQEGTILASNACSTHLLALDQAPTPPSRRQRQQQRRLRCGRLPGPLHALPSSRQKLSRTRGLPSAIWNAGNRFPPFHPSSGAVGYLVQR